MCFDRCSVLSSTAILIRWASPPDRVVGDCPKHQVAEAGILQHLDLPAHRALAGEERQPLRIQHLQQAVDGLAAQGDLKRLLLNHGEDLRDDCSDRQTMLLKEEQVVGSEPGWRDSI